MPLRHLPLQRKLVGFILLTSLSVLLLSYLPLLIYEMRSSYQTTNRNLTTVADIIASNSTAALIYDDRTLASELLSALHAEPDVMAAALYSKDGKVFALYTVRSAETVIPPRPAADGVAFTDGSLVLFRPVTQGGDRVGTLYIKGDLGAMYRRLRVYALVLVTVLLGAGVLAYFLSNFFQRQISQPILHLADTARTVSEGKDFSVRATKSSGDELGFVTEAFNKMLDQIQQHHAEITESEERFRAVADNAPVLIWLAGTDGLCTWVNQHWRDFAGLPPATDVAGVWRELIHPDDRERCHTIYDTSFAGRIPFRMEYRMLRCDGEYRWLLDHGAPRYLGDEFSGFIGSCVDITDRKDAEALVRSSELQMRLVTDHASVFLCHIDRHHRFKFANRAYADRYGRQPAELVGMHLSEIIGRSAYDVVKDRINSTLAGHREEFEAELPYSTLGVRIVHYVYEPERTADGQVAGLVSVLNDVTERRKAEQELASARDRAVAASRAKDDFLAALSHELRTPLNPVLLLASDAATNAALPAAIRADFETIRRNVELEARLIDDLLDLTRITRGKLALDVRVVDAHAIIADTIATVRADVDAKNITLETKLTPMQPKLRGDAVRLQQVLWNVVKNAVKFTPSGGRITIADEWSEERRMLFIRVTDTGIGMVPSELQRIFEAFVQGEHAIGGAHRFGGIGLGLAISRRIVELHQGEITARSEGRDRGCTFTIALPALKPETASPNTRNPLALPAPPPGLTRPEVVQTVILLVEDHAPTRQALETLLQRRHYLVRAAGSVAEAMAIAEKGGIDIVISDIGLPDGTGFELMTDLKTRFGLRGIALTGYGMESDLLRSDAAGFVTHLTKPVRMQSLDQALAAIVATT